MWQAYLALPYAPGAGLAGFYATWMARVLDENILLPPQLQTYKGQITRAILSYVAADEELELSALLDNRRAFDQCFFHLQTWYPGLGAAGRRFVERIEQLCAGLQQGPELWCDALEAFNKLSDRELDKAAVLAERMKTSELGRIRAASAQQRVTDLYNQVVAQRPLPESALVFVEEVVLPNLQYTLINSPEQDSAWHFWERALRLLVWSLNPEKSEEDRQAFFQKGPALLAQLEAAQSGNVCSPEVYQSHLNEISGLIITLLKGQTQETLIAPKKQVSAEAESLKHLQAAGAEHHFSVGDWIEFDDGRQRLRCQYLMQVPGTDRLLFVNRNGHKVLQKSVAEMSACLEAGIAHEIPHLPVLSATLTAVNARMAQLQQQLQARALARQRERERLARKARPRKRQSSRSWLRAKRLRPRPVPRPSVWPKRGASGKGASRELREAEEREAHEQAMRDKLDQLTLGTWADLPLEKGKTVRCKLAVSLRSTGKFIFVDRVGTKVAELKYDELLAFLIEGKAVFYQPEQDFENRLETIVRGLRRTE